MVYDPETGNEPPENKIDEVPLSFFMDNQRQEDAVWEWFIHSIKEGTKLLVGVSGQNTQRVYVVTPYGAFAVLTYDVLNDIMSGITYLGQLMATVDDWTISGMYPEIIQTGLYEFVDWNEADEWIRMNAVKYYSFGKSYPQFGVLNSILLTCSDAYEFYNKVKGTVWEAARLSGILEAKPKSSMAAKFDANRLMADLGIEEQANTAWSESMWPELPGYNTVYIDNIGIFTPTGYYVDQVMTNALRELDPAFRLANRCVILHKEGAGTMLTDAHNQQILQLLGLIPVIGDISNAISGVTRAWNANPGLVWPRVYAFGRNPAFRVASQNDVNYYAAHARALVQQNVPAGVAGQYFGIQPLIIDNIAEPLISKCKQLVDTLVTKGYISRYQAGDWSSVRPGIYEEG